MITIKRFPQPGLVECGPAAICAVMSSFPELSYKFTIPAVINAAGATTTIQQNGTNLAQLAQAVTDLSQDSMTLLFKSHGTIDEIKSLLGQNTPVVVNWQGSTFKAEDGERGHYSVVVEYQDSTQTLVLIDSLPDFPTFREVFTHEFQKKWHDFDSIYDTSGKETVKQNHQVMAFIIPKESAQELQSQYKFIPADRYFHSVT
jgi:hypothetical protein